MLRHPPAGGKACNGRQCFKWNTINYSSCYATSLACEVKRNSLEKWRKKASAQKLQGPSLHSAPGYFYSFYFPSNELFTFSPPPSFPGAIQICACPCITRHWAKSEEESWSITMRVYIKFHFIEL